ncbi:MAG: ATP-binding protein [Bryobacteraceae bacterium]
MSSKPARDDSLESFPQESAEELYESAPCGYLSTTPDGLIVRVNETFACWLGYTRNELIGRMHFLDLLTAGGKIFYETHFALLLRMHGQVREISVDFRRKDGSLLPSLISAAQKRDAAGVPIVNRISVFDTSERRNYERELLVERRRAEQTSEELAQINAELARSNTALLKANQELGGFVYAASHDLQEPLRTVTAYAQLLARRFKGELDGDALLFLSNIVEGALRMQNLIADLLSFSHIDGSNLVFHFTEMSKPLEEAISNLRSSIEESGAIVTSDALPSASADSSRITQVFQNLLGNAIKYRKPTEPPRIHISCATNEHEHVLSVRDNGVGFDNKYAEQIFGMFKRLHGREIPGTGIGLAICRKIVESHGGKIWTESTPGAGSTFSFTIPVSTPE